MLVFESPVDQDQRLDTLIPRLLPGALALLGTGGSTTGLPTTSAAWCGEGFRPGFGSFNLFADVQTPGA